MSPAGTMAGVGLPTRKYEVDLVLKGRAHFYQVTEKTGKVHVFPGVTGKLNVINKPALIPWATKMALQSAEAALLARLKGKKKARVELTPEWIAGVIAEAKEKPDQVKKDAADLGTLAHAAIDRIFKGEKLDMKDVDEKVKVPVANFMEWFNNSGIMPVMGDTRVASIQEKFGGSLDALGFKDGRYILLDWKTSNGIYDEYALQVAAYAHAFEETFGVPVGEAIIVRFDKTKPEWDPKKDVKTVANLTISYGAFSHASELQQLLKDYSHFNEQ